MRIMDDVGIKVHKLKGLKLHAKLLFADGVRAIIGSINLAPGSFDSRRELAIEVRDQEVMDRLHTIVHRDWKNSRPLDLTDDGLMAELEDTDDNVAEDLALDCRSQATKRSAAVLLSTNFDVPVMVRETDGGHPNDNQSTSPHGRPGFLADGIERYCRDPEHRAADPAGTPDGADRIRHLQRSFPLRFDSYQRRDLRRGHERLLLHAAKSRTRRPDRTQHPGL